MTGVIVDEKYIVGHTAHCQRRFNINITVGGETECSLLDSYKFVFY
jgi:hypothetical protein